ncbi:2',3'-cyclic-nucleotide 3'-phosphodiesterase-like [Gigantopelta aegis]|uniref:2',3'-cyclic-nucleotide 3'-phosphodiesterase-like n=1 Tax=Gigantopelta aegis TaxID=1735272 RepID=UPI001B88E05E|nr:2',3'-cyclic-nucleotide 3'-phosphodiesterase-like [Gigantopelta aegis]
MVTRHYLNKIDIMTLMSFYLTCVPDCTLIESKLPIFPEKNDIKSSNIFSQAEEGKIISNDDKSFKLNFPFLHDHATVKYLKDSKVMFIMRGLPGSGKSTIVRSIQSTYPISAVCSADDYFLKDGVYNFDPNKLGPAHETCRLRTEQHCQSGCPVVVIDNTNVKRWEMKEYLDLALRTNYVVVLVEPQTPWKFDARELARRNKHGLSEEILQYKVRLFQDFMPSYYGWFFNEADSRYFLRMGRKLVEECVDKIPELKQSLLAQFRRRQVYIPAHTDAKAIVNYFRRQNGNTLIHCTSKFLAHGRVPCAVDYHLRADVQGNCGKASCLTVTSIIITERTVGARVRLSKQQLQLFDKPEERERDELMAKAEESPSQEFASRGGASENMEGKPLRKQFAALELSSDDKSTMKINPFKLKNGKISKNGSADAKSINESESNMYKIVRSKPFNNHASLKPLCKRKEVKAQPNLHMMSASRFGRSAHITLATAEGIESRQTTFDILDICEVEAECPFEGRDSVPVLGGRAVYLGEGMCCIYLYKPLVFGSLFSGHY